MPAKGLLVRAIRSILLVATIVAACAAQSKVVQAADGSADRHNKVDALFAPWNGTTTPGCAVAISRNGALDYARGYGMSNLEYDIAISPESIFHAASISKQFTAFSVALLAKDGMLSLDDDVRKYVPELPDYGTPITIRHLLHHTSGLRDQYTLLALAGWREDDLITQDDVLQIVARQKALNFKPGSEYLYSNTGYTLLAAIVERVSKQSLRAFAEERIFKPLGMADTHFHDDHMEWVRRRTSAYQRRESGGWSVSIPMFDTYGATSLFTTALDLLKWEQNFVDARIGGPEVIEEVLRPAKLDDGSDTGYAAGLVVGTYRGLRFFGHSGSDAGYRANVVHFPDQKLAAAALCNGATIAPWSLLRKAAEVYLGDLMTKAPADVKVPESELASLAGTYWNETSEHVLRVQLQNGALAPASGGPPLAPLGSGIFASGDDGTTWRFSRDNADATPQLRVVPPASTTTPPYRRLAFDAKPSDAALAPLAGDYKSKELGDATYSIAVDDGRLRLRRAKREDITLEPIASDRFTSPWLGTITIAFTRGGPGTRQVDGFTLSNSRARRVRFDRIDATGAGTAVAMERTK